jgi:carbon monoxide dehydrogenase subunit G
VELNNDFEVSAPIDKTWAVLTDVERIAPCLPGAQLQEVEGDEYRGIVKVKVGPITAQYKGAASFVERDDDNYRAVLKADGRDTRGAGNASALITATAEPSGDRTKVTVSTDLTVTGKVAQFGRGVMADVSAKLMGQFADNLEKLLEGGGEPAAAPAAAPEPPAAAAPTATAEATPEATPSGNGAGTTSPAAVRKIDSPEPQAVDLLDTAGAPVLKRLAPVAVVLFALFLLRRKFRKRA